MKYCVILVDVKGVVQYFGNLPTYDHAKDVESVALTGLTVHEKEQREKRFAAWVKDQDEEFEKMVPPITLEDASKWGTTHWANAKEIVAEQLETLKKLSIGELYTSKYGSAPSGRKVSETHVQPLRYRSSDKESYWYENNRTGDIAIKWSRVLVEPEEIVHK